MKFYKSSEFWLCAIIAPFFPAVVAAYSVSRGMAKKGSLYKNRFKSSEFWLTVAAFSYTFYYGMTVAGIVVISGYILSRGIAKLQHVKTHPIIHI